MIEGKRQERSLPPGFCPQCPRCFYYESIEDSIDGNYSKCSINPNINGDSCLSFLKYSEVLRLEAAVLITKFGHTLPQF